MQLLILSVLLLALGSTQALLTSSPIDNVINAVANAAKLTPTLNLATRIRRSTSLTRLTAHEFNRCKAVGQRFSCDTGTDQEVYILALECQQPEFAEDVLDACSINENGLYCSQGIDLSNQFAADTSSACFSITSCSSTCRDSISRLRNQLGCCSRFWTETSQGTNSNLDGFLWSACGFNTNTRCTLPAFNSTITTNRICTLTELQNMAANHRCLPENGNPLVASIANTTGCAGVAQAHVENCDRDSSGNLCSLNQGVNTAVTMVTNCAADLASGTCSSSCHSAMITLRNEIGCCINSIYNGTLARVSPIPNADLFLRLFTNSFWLRCGVTPPGRCQSTLSPISSSSGSLGSMGALSITMVIIMAAVLF